MDDSTRRITQQKQTLDEAYSPPGKQFTQILKTFAANYLEISVNDPVTHGEGRTRFTDFRMEMKTNMPVFKVTLLRALFRIFLGHLVPKY